MQSGMGISVEIIFPLPPREEGTELEEKENIHINFGRSPHIPSFWMPHWGYNVSDGIFIWAASSMIPTVLPFLSSASQLWWI
jgi:hypothetical protein